MQRALLPPFRAAGDGQLALVHAKPGAAGDPPRKTSPAGGSAVVKGAGPGCEASRPQQWQQGSIQPAESSSSSSSRGATAPAGDSPEGELSAALGSLQLKAQSSSLMEELAAKYDCTLDQPDR